jgi:hypothetical protein
MEFFNRKIIGKLRGSTKNGDSSIVKLLEN